VSDLFDFVGSLGGSWWEVGGGEMGELTDDDDDDDDMDAGRHVHKKVKFDHATSSSTSALPSSLLASRLVKKGGKVRGETLEGLEYATNVVASSVLLEGVASAAAAAAGVGSSSHGGSSSSSSSSRRDGFDDAVMFVVEEQVSRTPADLLLARIPRRLYDALGRGQFKVLRRIVDEHFDERCTFRTCVMEEALVGREHVARYFEAYERSHPDMVFVIRNARVVTDPEGRAIKYKFFWTGTNIAPLSNSMVYNPQNKLTKYLDNALVRKKELASIKSLANKVKATGQPYVSLGHGAGRMSLDANNKVVKFVVYWKFLSIKHVDLSQEVEVGAPKI